MPPKHPLLSRLRLGLEAKFVVLATMVIVVATGIGNRLILLHEESLLREEANTRAVVLAESMAQSFTYTLIYEELGLVEEAGLLDLFVEDIMARPDMEVRAVKLLDTEGRVVAHSDYRQFGRLDADFRARYGSGPQRTRAASRMVDGEPLLEVTTPLHIGSKSWGNLSLAISLRPMEQELKSFANRLGYLTLAAIFAGLLVAFLVAHALARPIKRLGTAMAQVGPELETLMQVDRSDEIGLLQSGFREMLDRLRAARQEQERTREAMLRAEKLAAVGSLAAGVAHEINNPLGGVKNCLAQIASHPEDRERLSTYVGLMDQALGRIEQVVRGLLDFSRRRGLETAPVALAEVVESSLALLSYRLEKAGIACAVELAPDLPVIQGDRHQLQQVLVNLIINAADAMAQGGQLRLRGWRQGEWALLQVQDTGPGIPAELERRIFDPFFTTKGVGKGTGLGLTVSLYIVREHGGDLSLSRPPGGGAAFTVSLPLRGARPEEDSG